MSSNTQFGPWLDRPMRSLSPEVVPFWEALRAGRFVMCACKLCDRHYWPYTVCPHHDQIPDFSDMEWRQVSGLGSVFTYVVVHRVTDPAYAGETPYALAMIKLDEGPIFPSRIVDCEPAEVRIGLRVALRLVRSITKESGNVFPMFAPVDPCGATNDVLAEDP